MSEQYPSARSGTAPATLFDVPDTAVGVTHSESLTLHRVTGTCGTGLYAACDGRRLTKVWLTRPAVRYVVWNARDYPTLQPCAACKTAAVGQVAS